MLEHYRNSNTKTIVVNIWLLMTNEYLNVLFWNTTSTYFVVLIFHLNYYFLLILVLYSIPFKSEPLLHMHTEPPNNALPPTPKRWLTLWLIIRLWCGWAEKKCFGRLSGSLLDGIVGIIVLYIIYSSSMAISERWKLSTHYTLAHKRTLLCPDKTCPIRVRVLSLFKVWCIDS